MRITYTYKKGFVIINIDEFFIGNLMIEIYIIQIVIAIIKNATMIFIFECCLFFNKRETYKTRAYDY
jgi:hypothetical protein